MSTRIAYIARLAAGAATGFLGVIIVINIQLLSHNTLPALQHARLSTETLPLQLLVFMALLTGIVITFPVKTNQQAQLYPEQWESSAYKYSREAEEDTNAALLLLERRKIGRASWGALDPIHHCGVWITQSSWGNLRGALDATKPRKDMPLGIGSAYGVEVHVFIPSAPKVYSEVAAEDRAMHLQAYLRDH